MGVVRGWIPREFNIDRSILSIPAILFGDMALTSESTAATLTSN
jgi:hypothetical protein